MDEKTRRQDILHFASGKPAMPSVDVEVLGVEEKRRVPGTGTRLTLYDSVLVMPRARARPGGRLAARASDLCMRYGWIRAIRSRELIHLTLGFFLRDAVALLDAADELITFPADALEVVVGQLAPVFFHSA